MAKVSVIEREKKRARVVAKYAARRADLKAIIGDRNRSDDERWDAQLQLQKLPRNASPIRLQRRCGITGRPRGCVSQVRPRPQQAARCGHARRCSGPGQGKLVGERL